MRKCRSVNCGFIIVWGCGSKSGKHKGLGFFRIPKIIADQGEEYEELTRKRRAGWISAASRGDTAEKNILETPRTVHTAIEQPE